jgi:Tfp pilus assembly protein PilX
MYLMYMVDNKKKQSGFALLVSLIVVGAVLSIGLVIIDLSIKQVRLAATTKDSEIAFHAANAGMECARYWRRQASTSMEAGAQTSQPLGCFSVIAADIPGSSNSVVNGPGRVSAAPAAAVATTGSGSAYAYEYEFTWGTPGVDERCTSITTVVAVSNITGPGVTIDNMRDLIPGYTSATLSCGAASRCTAVSVQGYNRRCLQKNGFGTIQREVLLEF